ncbi:MAG TPA: ATP-binding protein [Ktedonobacteraceae bacterium]
MTDVEQITHAFVALDLQWQVVYVNQQAKEVLRRTRGELLGKNLWEAMPDYVGTPLYDYCQQAVSSGKAAQFEVKIPRSQKWFRIDIFPSPGESSIFFTEITAWKLAEERLRQSEKNFRALIENNAEGIALTDENGIITYASPSTTRMVGYLPEEFVGGRIFGRDDYPDGGEATRRLMARILEEPRKSQMLEFRTGHKNGTFVWMEVVGINFLDEPGVEAIVWNFRDVTEKKELEQRKDHFISMASHELKTPLTILSAYTQLLYERFAAEGRQDAVLMLSKMDDQITNLTKLVTDLLDISKMQAGQLELALEAVDMDTLVREVVENLQPITTHRLLIEGSAERSVPGDRSRLAQVLINLLTNAIKYSPHADTVIVRVRHTHDTLTVSVQDFGIGIPQSHQQRLFERFYRVLSRKDQTYPGLGIGLYIAHEIIQRHGGKMWVESAEGKGSIFFFSLPIREEKL